MTLAYVLVNTKLGMEEEVLSSLRAFHPVREAYVVYGVYDILLKVEAEDQAFLKETVFTVIRKMDGVQSTLTMIVLEE